MAANEVALQALGAKAARTEPSLGILRGDKVPVESELVDLLLDNILFDLKPQSRRLALAISLPFKAGQQRLELIPELGRAQHIGGADHRAIEFKSRKIPSRWHKKLSLRLRAEGQRIWPRCPRFARSAAGGGIAKPCAAPVSVCQALV